MHTVSAQFEVPLARFEVGGLTMTYRDTHAHGDADPSGAIVCVHGNPTWSYYFRGVAQRFGGKQQFGGKRRVIAIDHIGCGGSDKPSRADFDYRLANHQENLVALIEHLGLEQIHLLAHDWGGAVGLGAVVKRPERFGSIMLLNTGAFPPMYIPWRIAACRLPGIGTAAVRGLNLFARAAITMAMDRNRLEPDVARGLLAPYDSWEHRVAIDAFVKDIPMSPSHPTHATLVDLEAKLPSLADMPSLLVWGMKDWCFRPDCLRKFQAVWPNAKSVEIADAGHYVLEDAPEETLSAIADFLDEHAS